MMKQFTPPRLRLLDPTSNGLTLSIILKSVNTSVYNAQKALKPISMAPECLCSLFLLLIWSKIEEVMEFHILLLIALQIPQNLAPSYKFSPKHAKGVTISLKFS